MRDATEIGSGAFCDFPASISLSCIPSLGYRCRPATSFAPGFLSANFEMNLKLRAVGKGIRISVFVRTRVVATPGGARSQFARAPRSRRRARRCLRLRRRYAQMCVSRTPGSPTWDDPLAPPLARVAGERTLEIYSSDFRAPLR